MSVLHTEHNKSPAAAIELLLAVPGSQTRGLGGSGSGCILPARRQREEPGLVVFDDLGQDQHLGQVLHPLVDVPEQWILDDARAAQGLPPP